jgi:hypothetical protein
MPRRLLPLSLAATLAAQLSCAGPQASDAAVCRDVIHRLCLEPRCPAFDDRVVVGGDCEGELLARTGCGDDAFSFDTPDRGTFLACRASLGERSGLDPGVRPDCEDVQTTFDRCPGLVDFLEGRR